MGEKFRAVFLQYRLLKVSLILGLFHSFVIPQVLKYYF
jgi:hypothetical protein